MEVLIQRALTADNIPFLLLLPGSLVLLVAWWRVAKANDRRLKHGGVAEVARAMAGEVPDGSAEGEAPDRSLNDVDRSVRNGSLHSWPFLVRLEALAALAVLLLLTVWSVLVDAPLTQLADPSRTPNPSKAPWYFVGLQELLVYFDPWIAGVALPLLIVVGLCAIPYLDVNPRGSGYHSWRGRRFAVTTFLFGLVGLWLPLMVVGLFFRGPGWAWFWPWQPWRTDIASSPHQVNLSDLFNISSQGGAALLGGLVVLGYYLLPAVLFWRRHKSGPTLRRMGTVRYAVTAFLLLTMLALPLRIALRVTLGLKYLLVTPWFNL